MSSNHREENECGESSIWNACLPPDENGVARQYFGCRRSSHRRGRSRAAAAAARLRLRELPQHLSHGGRAARASRTPRKPAGKSLAEIVAQDGSRRRANLGDPPHAERPAGEDRAGLSDALLRPCHTSARSTACAACANWRGWCARRRCRACASARCTTASPPATGATTRSMPNASSSTFRCASHLDELRQRPALRSRSPAPPRPGGDRLPGTQDHRRAGRLAVDQRHGRTAAPAPEPRLRHRLAPSALLRHRGLWAGRCCCSSATRCCRTR